MHMHNYYSLNSYWHPKLESALKWGEKINFNSLNEKFKKYSFETSVNSKESVSSKDKQIKR